VSKAGCKKMDRRISVSCTLVATSNSIELATIETSVASGLPKCSDLKNGGSEVAANQMVSKSLTMRDCASPRRENKSLSSESPVSLRTVYMNISLL
jgi:hypothetical protein